jgi:hypothetical protein
MLPKHLLVGRVEQSKASDVGGREAELRRRGRD